MRLKGRNSKLSLHKGLIEEKDFLKMYIMKTYLLQDEKLCFVYLFFMSEFNSFCVVPYMYESEIYFVCTGKKQIWNLQPFSAKDFQIRGLAERINDLPQLHILYPDIPKQNAFSRFMTQTSKLNLLNELAKIC